MPLAASTSQLSYEPGASDVEEIVRPPPESAVQVDGAKGMAGFPGAGVYAVCSVTCPPGVSPLAVNVNTVDADPLAGLMLACGLTGATPVPVSANVCVVESAATVSVAVRAPSAVGLNCAVTVQNEFGCSEPATLQVDVHGNSSALESDTLATGTAPAPVFHSVMTTGAVDVVPTPVEGKASVTHVMTNVDGVTGVVGEVVLLEQPATRIANETRARLPDTIAIVATAALAIV